MFAAATSSYYFFFKLKIQKKNSAWKPFYDLALK